MKGTKKYKEIYSYCLFEESKNLSVMIFSFKAPLHNDTY